jgi:hypothetical protein
MRRQRSIQVSARPKLLDTVYLVMSALGIVCVLIVLIVFQIAYEKAPWMPHGDRAIQLTMSVIGFVTGSLYLSSAWQSRNLHRELPHRRYASVLEALGTPQWASAGLGISGVAIGVYFLYLFAANRHVDMNRASDVFQLFLGLVLLISGSMLLRAGVLLRRRTSHTSPNVVFGFFLPALLIAAGAWRLLVAGLHFTH